MLTPLRKLLNQSTRFPAIPLLAGLLVGVPIGWFLGTRSTVEEIAIPPAKATTYTTLSNDELKDKSAQLVTAIRNLARSYYDDDNRMRISADEQSGKTDSQAERERIRKTWLNDSAKLHDAIMDRYKINYWADALLLREAIVAKVGGAPGAQNAILFQHPTNILGVEQVANGLELLGKSLPAKAPPNP
jgi:hypothetical protein